MISAYDSWSMYQHETWGTFSTPQTAAEHLDLEENFKDVPENGLVIDIASGAAFSLEAVAYIIRPDIRVVGLDMGYALPGMEREERDDIEQISSFFDAEQQALLNENRSWYSRLVAGLAEQLPVKSGAADLVMSFAGIPQYAINDEMALDEVVRVLKPGGKAVLGPMRDWILPSWENTLEAASINYETRTREIETQPGVLVDAYFTTVVK